MAMEAKRSEAFRQGHESTMQESVDERLDIPTPSQLIASAAKFLIEGGEEEAASVLLSCTVLEIGVGSGSFSGDRTIYSAWIRLRGPRIAHELLSDATTEIYGQVHKAVKAVLPDDLWLEYISIGAELLDIAPDWHAELLELIRGKSIHNQAAGADNAKTWQGFRFRSVTEIRIAEALDKANVLFFPLPKGRLNGPRGRVNREPDFLVCNNGKWGILEVDGEPYHPPQRTVHDHERDRLFHQHGIRVAQHFDATDCFATPDKVVGDFLRLLEKAY
jgi:hypothetical protein